MHIAKMKLLTLTTFFSKKFIPLAIKVKERVYLKYALSVNSKLTDILFGSEELVGEVTVKSSPSITKMCISKQRELDTVTTQLQPTAAFGA